MGLEKNETHYICIVIKQQMNVRVWVLFQYLEVGDLKSSIFHQADSTIISQNPLAIFFPLYAGHGVAHDVTV